jgi:aarF domain-containing kinase
VSTLLFKSLVTLIFKHVLCMCRYFALIIRAISVLEGIALVGNPDFAIIDEAYPYLAQRLLTDDHPRLRESLHYMVYGKSNVFDTDRLIDLLNAFETFTVSSRSASGDFAPPPVALPVPAPSVPVPTLPIPLRPPPFLPQPQALMDLVAAATASGQESPGMFRVEAAEKPSASWQTLGREATGGTGLRAALLFLLSDSGTFFRTFLMDEIVRSIDALSRSQLAALVQRLGLQGVMVPVFLPFAKRASIPLAPGVSAEDEKQVEAVAKLMDFLAGGSTRSLLEGQGGELLSLLPQVARQIVPEVVMSLTSRIAARFVRTFYL